MIKVKNTQRKVRIFVYLIGDNNNSKIHKALTCQNKGNIIYL